MEGERAVITTTGASARRSTFPQSLACSRRVGGSQIERQRRKSPRQFFHFFFVQALCALLCFIQRGQHQVLEHFDIFRIDYGPIDFDFTNSAASIHRYGHHPTTARARDRAISQLALELGQTGLDLLAQLEKLLKIAHVSKTSAIS
jgi:hypothetical protein